MGKKHELRICTYTIVWSITRSRAHIGDTRHGLHSYAAFMPYRNYRNFEMKKRDVLLKAVHVLRIMIFNT